MLIIAFACVTWPVERDSSKDYMALCPGPLAYASRIRERGPPVIHNNQNFWATVPQRIRALARVARAHRNSHARTRNLPSLA